MSNIAIVIVHDILRLDEKLIIDELRKRSVPFTLLNIDSAIFDLESATLQKGGDVILVRSVSHTRSVIAAQIYEEAGHVVINSSTCLEVGGNKFITLMRLVKAGLPVPKTILTFSPDRVEYAYKILTSGVGPVIVKPISGSWGRMVSLVSTSSELNLLVRHRAKMESPHLKMYMLQEYVEKPQRDIRIIVVDGEAVAGIYRYAPEGEWRTNTARGGIARPLKLDEELKELSVKACEAINAKYGGVDIVESRDGYKILEVNVVPEFKNVARVTGVNIAEKIVDMLIRHAKR